MERQGGDMHTCTTALTATWNSSLMQRQSRDLISNPKSLEVVKRLINFWAWSLWVTFTLMTRCCCCCCCCSWSSSDSMPGQETATLRSSLLVAGAAVELVVDVSLPEAAVILKLLLPASAARSHSWAVACCSCCDFCSSASSVLSWSMYSIACESTDTLSFWRRQER